MLKKKNTYGAIDATTTGNKASAQALRSALKTEAQWVELHGSHVNVTLLADASV